MPLTAINVDFEYCYGIKKLAHTFDFSKRKSYMVYAPNGVMKSSFARVFQDISKDKKPVDRIFPEKDTKFLITDQDNKSIASENIFVIESYNEEFKSEKVATLLVNKKLREEYEHTYEKINEKKESLLKELKALSGFKKSAEIETAISESIMQDSKEFFKALVRVKEEVKEAQDPLLSQIVYTQIFNDKVESLLSSDDFRAKLKEYINIYDRLLEDSQFFKKGVFNHNNASDTAKALKSNGFFKANHSVYISTLGTKVEITTEDELEKAIEKEKEGILNNPELQKSFEVMDKALSKNKDVKDFREYIEKNKFLLSELDNLARLKSRLWVSYLNTSLGHYNELIDVYMKSRSRLEEIIAQAKTEGTKWGNVINIFNKRFSVPFVVRMENQEDVILNDDVPSIKFEFKSIDGGKNAKVNEDKLISVLSNGERRALYILNIIFEVEARKESNNESIFIVDDIADSFDYKNKYAIVEYLKDISEEDRFFQIILTHNFDFYRTVSGRLDLKREHKLHTIKNSDGILLIEEKYQNNPFSHWKDNLSSNQEMLIASIPFVRNLAEFCGYGDEKEFLTSLLHIENNTKVLKIKDLENTFKSILVDKTLLTLPNSNSPVLDEIYKLSDHIYGETEAQMELEKKIVLSIAIRLKAEEYMITQINDPSYVDSITKNQTFELIKRYKQDYPTKIDEIKLLEQVNLMTPENIHINSFMYEPILDMDNEHLKKLYHDISNV